MRDFEQLVAELADEASIVKRAPHPYLLSMKLVGAAAVYLVVSLAVSGLRQDWAQAIGRPWFVAELVTLGMVFLTASLSASLLSFPDLHQKRGQAFLPLWMFGLFLGVVFLAWRADSPAAVLPEHTIECSSWIVLLALLPTAWTFYVMRNYASTHGHWAGGAAVLTAFSIGALWLRLQETNDSIVHVIEWHYLPMLAFCVAGLWMGKWALKW
ncbi:MAG: DUF1109 domain-containing protein [Rhodocyclaceae bacterium]|nr:MAG: DUF1109 domain-containing protein [Rhodocyclaceae bacterium]